MYLTCYRRYVARERFYVCGKELSDAPVFQYQVDYRVLVCKSAQSLLVCRITVSHALLWLYLRVQIELLEYERAYLDRREYVQVRVFCHFPDLLLEPVHFESKSCSISSKLYLVYFNTFDLHFGKNLDKRFLESIVELCEIRLLHFLPYLLAEKEGYRNLGFMTLRFIFRYLVKEGKAFLFFLDRQQFLYIYIKVCL